MIIEYTDFLDKNKTDKNIVVCGLGLSLNDFKNPENYTTIGCNDISRAFHPNYLLLLNGEKSFTPDRWKNIIINKSDYVLTHRPKEMDNLLQNPYTVSLKLGKMGGVNFDSYNIEYSTIGPYMGVIIAYHLGAKKIGLIGVDLNNQNCFKDRHNHSQIKNIDKIKKHFDSLLTFFKNKNVNLFNLSKISVFNNIPYKSIEDFNSDITFINKN